MEDKVCGRSHGTVKIDITGYARTFRFRQRQEGLVCEYWWQRWDNERCIGALAAAALANQSYCQGVCDHGLLHVGPPEPLLYTVLLAFTAVQSRTGSVSCVVIDCTATGTTP